MISEHEVIKLTQTVSSPSIPSSPHHLSSLFLCPLSLYLLLKIHLFSLLPLHRPPGLTGSPVISDISLIRLSPHAVAGTGESPFSPPHPYVSPHMEHYLRSVHGSPTLSMISAARGLSPAEGKIYPTSQHKTLTEISTYKVDVAHTTAKDANCISQNNL